MTALWIACGEDANPKHRVSFSTDSIGTEGPSAKSFYRARGRENPKN